MNLLDLPDDIIRHISSFLTHIQAVKLSAVNLRIRKLVPVEEKIEQIKLEKISHIRGSVYRFKEYDIEKEIFKLHFEPRNYGRSSEELSLAVLIDILYSLNIWPVEHLKMPEISVMKRFIVDYIWDCYDFSPNKILFFYQWFNSSSRAEIPRLIKNFLVKHDKIKYFN